MQNFVLLFFSAVTGLFPINLDLKTFYSSEKEIPVERIYSQNFKENNYVSSFSKNGYLWIEADLYTHPQYKTVPERYKKKFPPATIHQMVFQSPEYLQHLKYDSGSLMQNQNI